jgi:hypothetical protein
MVYPMAKILKLMLYSSLSLGSAAIADDSTFLCDRIDEEIALLFSATSVVSKSSDGSFGTPVDVTFGYMGNGEAPVWTTKDGSTRFILMQNQIFVMDAAGSVAGKIVCK